VELWDCPFPLVPIPDFGPDFAEIDGLIAGFASTYSQCAEDSVSLPLSHEEIIVNCEKSLQNALMAYKPSSEEEKKEFEEFLVYKSVHDEIIMNVKEIIDIKKVSKSNEFNIKQITKMTKTNFYELISLENIPEKYCASWSDKDVELETIICPVNDGHRGSRDRLSNLTVIIKDGNAFKYDWLLFNNA